MTAEPVKTPEHEPAHPEPVQRPLSETVRAIEARQRAKTQELVDALRKTTEGEL